MRKGRVTKENLNMEDKGEEHQEPQETEQLKSIDKQKGDRVKTGIRLQLHS
jgi:hypothetical protein